MSINRDVTFVAMMGFDELHALNKHTSRTTTRVVYLATIRLYHFSNQVDDGFRGIVLPFSFTFGNGKLGKEILLDLLLQDGFDASKVLHDCGASLFFEEQQTYQGASGAACTALVFNCHLLHKLAVGKYKRILLAGTGALMSPTSSFQGDSIPAITHVVEVQA